MRIFTPVNANPIPSYARLVFKGEIFNVYQWDQEMFDGNTKTFEMLERPDSVETIAVHGDKILVCKERQPHTDYFLDIPAGMHDNEGEDELAAARRELREETGYTFKNWRLLSARQPSKKIDQICYTFLATDLENKAPQVLDAGEEITVLEYTFAEFQKMKRDPLTRSYPSHVMDDVETLDDLLALPAIHEY